MTPAHKFRPKWRDRCLYRRKHWLRNASYILLALLIAIGFWPTLTAEQRVAEANLRAIKAEADRQEVLDILSGKLSMKEPLGEYEKVADIQWTFYKRGTGVRVTKKNGCL